jgi:hypothetical protein
MELLRVTPAPGTIASRAAGHNRVVAGPDKSTKETRTHGCGRQKTLDIFYISTIIEI